MAVFRPLSKRDPEQGDPLFLVPDSAKFAAVTWPFWCFFVGVKVWAGCEDDKRIFGAQPKREK